MNFAFSLPRVTEYGRLLMKQGDHVKVIGRDGFYIFIKEVQGTASLRSGIAPGSSETTLDIPVSRIISLEKFA